MYCVCILLFSYFDRFMNYLVHFALWTFSEPDAISRHAAPPELPFPFKKNWGYFQESPFLVTRVYVTTSVGVVGGRREHVMSLHQVASVTSNQQCFSLIPASRTAWWGDDPSRWLGGAFLACVLLCEIDMQVSHMRWGPGTLHVRWTMHECLIMPDS